MSVSQMPRQPAGTASGGQFAPTAHNESDVQLDPETVLPSGWTDDDLDRSFDSYLECAAWSSYDIGDGEDDEPAETLDGHDFSDGAAETLRSEFVEFVSSNHDDIAESGQDASQVGHDFWLTRNGHGAGFWDRGLGDIGRRLTEASRPYGTVDLWLDRDTNLIELA